MSHRPLALRILSLPISIFLLLKCTEVFSLHLLYLSASSTFSPFLSLFYIFNTFFQNFQFINTLFFFLRSNNCLKYSLSFKFWTLGFFDSSLFF